MSIPGRSCDFKRDDFFSGLGPFDGSQTLLDDNFYNNSCKSELANVGVNDADVSLPLTSFPAALDDREPTSISVVPSGFTFLLANIRGFVSKTADLEYLVERSNYPTYIGFTETFLDKAKVPILHGYTQVARLDRRTGEKQGGIILFAKVGFERGIVHLGDSEVHERSWFLLHSDRGPILLDSIVGLHKARLNRLSPCTTKLASMTNRPSILS